MHGYDAATQALADRVLGLLEDAANHAPHGLLQRRLAPRDHLAGLRATLAASSPPSPPPNRAGRLHR